MAIAEGYFDKVGLDLTLVPNLGTAAVNSMVAGQIDLLLFGPGAGLAAVKQGKPLTYVLQESAPTGVALVSTPSIKSIPELQALKDCTFASLPSGTVAYAYTTLYSRNLRLNCKIVQVSSFTLIVAGLKSGAYQAGGVPQVPALAARDAGNLSLLVNNMAPDFLTQYNIPNFIGAAVYGTTTSVSAKKEAIVRYIEGYFYAYHLLASDSNLEQVAKDLIKVAPGTYQAIPYSTLLQQIRDFLPLVRTSRLGPQLGYINNELWQANNTVLASAGLDVDPADPIYSYKALVDMTFYDQALERYKAATGGTP